jgi:hypothetical protein
MIVADDDDRQAREALERDELVLAGYATALADAVEAHLPGWVERSVDARLPGAVPAEVAERARLAGRRAAVEVGARVRELLATDIDRQWTNPLAILRTAVRYPAEVLLEADAPRPARDRESERLHPDDVYDLTPAAFADIDPALHEPGIVWGAAKAHVHLARRRLEGRR